MDLVTYCSQLPIKKQLICSEMKALVFTPASQFKMEINLNFAILNPFVAVNSFFAENSFINRRMLVLNKLISK